MALRVVGVVPRLHYWWRQRPRRPRTISRHTSTCTSRTGRRPRVRRDQSHRAYRLTYLTPCRERQRMRVGVSGSVKYGTRGWGAARSRSALLTPSAAETGIGAAHQGHRPKRGHDPDGMLMMAGTRE